MTAQVHAVLFDYGGVLTRPLRESISAWITDEWIDPASFTATLKAWLGRNAQANSPIHRLETGELPEAQFDAQFAAALRTTHGAPVDPGGVLRRMFARVRPDLEMWRMATDLRELGVAVGVISNSWGGGNLYQRDRLAALFEPVIISEEVGLRKPDPAIYHLALDRLGVPAHHAVFIDDAAPNVDGAGALGLHGILHTEAHRTRHELSGLIEGLASNPTPSETENS